MTPINVISYFDGMGGGLSALKKAGIPVANYYAFEIEKHPMKIAKALHPEIVHLGNIKKIKVKSLLLSEAHAYIVEKYFYNDIHYLQGIIPEWEMLHRLEQEQTMATCFGTQIPNENSEIPPNSAIWRNDRIWFFKRKMGSSVGVFDIARSGSGGSSPNSTNVGKLLERSFWWNGYGQFKSKGKRKGVERIARQTSKRSNETEDSRSCNKTARKPRIKRDFKTTSLSAVQRSCFSAKILGRFESEGGKIKRKTAFKYSNPKGQLHERNVLRSTISNNKYSQIIHPKAQAYIIECEWGFLIAKGKIDLCVSGAPCQGFSRAGKGLNFEDHRSKLFFDFVNSLNEIKSGNPNVKFLLENVVPKKKEWTAIISQFMGIDPIMVNSSLLSAQHRKRMYWTNIGTKKVNLFGVEVPGIKLPKDKGIVLRDILEKEVDKKYYLGEESLQRLMTCKWANRFVPICDCDYAEKSKTLTTEPGKIRTTDNFIVETVDGQELPMEYLKIGKDGKMKLNQDKASCLTAGGNSGGNHSDMNLLFIYQRGRGFNDGGAHYEKSPTITGPGWVNNNHVVQQELLDFKVRRLTPREFGRLQTYSEDELDIILGAGVKDANLFKMFGNGFTRDVIAYFFEHLKNELI